MVHPSRSFTRRRIGIELTPQDSSLHDESVLVRLVNQLIADSQERDQEMRGQVDQLTSVVLDMQRTLSAFLNRSNAPHPSLPNNTAHVSRSPSPEPRSSGDVKPELMMVDDPESVPERTPTTQRDRSTVSSPSPPPPIPDPSCSGTKSAVTPQATQTYSGFPAWRERRSTEASLPTSKPTNCIDSARRTVDITIDETLDTFDSSAPSRDGVTSRAPVDSQSEGNTKKAVNAQTRGQTFEKISNRIAKQVCNDQTPSTAIREGDLATLRNDSVSLISGGEQPSNCITNVDAVPLAPSSYGCENDNNNDIPNKEKETIVRAAVEVSYSTGNHISSQNRADGISARRDIDDQRLNQSEIILRHNEHSEQTVSNPVSSVYALLNKEGLPDHASKSASRNNDGTNVDKPSLMQSSSKLLEPIDGTLTSTRDIERSAAEVSQSNAALNDAAPNGDNALREPIPSWILAQTESNAIGVDDVGNSGAHPMSKTGGRLNDQLVPGYLADRHPPSGNCNFTFSAEDSELPVDVGSDVDVAMTQEERTTAFEACIHSIERSEGGTDVPNTPIPEAEEIAPAGVETQPADLPEISSTTIAPPYHQKSKQLPNSEVIVISDDEASDDLRPIGNSQNHVPQHNKVEDEEISPNQYRRASWGEPCTIPVQAPSILSKKRRRVSMPFTNSMKGRDISYQDRNMSSPNGISSELSSRGESEEYEMEEQPSTPSPGSVGTPISFYGRRSCTPSEGDRTPQRPFKAPRTDLGNLTSEECEAFVHQADLLAQDFYKESGSNPRDVVELLDQAASSGSVEAMTRLARIYVKGIIGIGPSAIRIRRNHGKALHYVTMALKEVPDYPPALNIRGDLWLISRGKRSAVTQKAIRLFRKSALQGDRDGQCEIGQYWLSNFAYATTESRRRTCLQNAMLELKKAVDMNSGKAASLLGSIYENDSNLPIYNEIINLIEGRSMSSHERSMKAKGLYFQSMNWNCGEGTNDVAACYEVAYADVESNFDMAAELYRRAFELGHIGSAANLALLYELGAKDEFVDRVDQKLALKWYKIGNKVHCPVATNHLAFVYDNGTLADENKVLAERLFEAAINYADDFGKDLDIIPRAQEDLSALYITKALLQRPDAGEAIKKLKKMRCNSKGKGAMKFASAKKHLGWFAAAELNPVLYGPMQSAEIAIPSLVALLGEKNTGEVREYVRTLCNDVKSDSADVADSKARLQNILDRDVLRMIGL